ncbi:MAG: AI-2E family transporter [Anaerolineae bacterium]|nr:AI-2E family transporter [Anaerolineae bacterium]
MKQMMKYTAVILLTLTTLLVLWQFKLALLLFVLSLLMAAAIRPFVDGLVARGIPKGAAQLLLYVAGIGGFLLVLLLAGEWWWQELNLAVNQAVVEYESLHRRWEMGAGWQQTAVNLLPPPFTLAEAEQTELEQMAPAVMSITSSITGALAGLLALLALSIYWSVDQHRFERLWLSLLPVKRRAYARDSWREVETAVAGYLRSQTVQRLLAALFLAGGTAVVGFEFPLLLGFVGGLAAFVPLFGGLLTAVFALALGSLESMSLGLGLAVYTLLVFIGLELIVEPRLWPRKRRSFLLTILVILPLFEAFGLWGLIVAPPLAAAIEVMVVQVYQASITRGETAVPVERLQTRYQQLAQKIADSESEAAIPELQNLSQRLAHLLEKALRVSEN